MNDLVSVKVMRLRITVRDYGPKDSFYGRRKLGHQRWAFDFGRRSLILEWHQ